MLMLMLNCAASTTATLLAAPSSPLAQPRGVLVGYPLSAAVLPPPLPPPSRTNWTRLVPPSVLTRHVSSLPPY